MRAAPRKVYTTGQVAKLAGVSPGTAVKWIDSGRLKGYRIPGSQDRRVTREDLVRFLRDAGMPTYRVEAGTATVLVIGADPRDVAAIREAMEGTGGGSCRVEPASSAFEAGVRYAELDPGIVIVDLAIGRIDAGLIARGAGGAAAGRGGLPPVLVALAGADAPDEDAARLGFGAVLRRPVDAAAVARWAKEPRGRA